MYSDRNMDWGYNKVSLVQREDDSFDLFYLCEDPYESTGSLIKHFRYPACFTEGLRKIHNLKSSKGSAQLKSNFIKRIFKF